MDKECLRPPSLEVWRGLYETAITFNDMAPWQWMWDADVVAVRSELVWPETGYCAVLGRNKSFYGFEVCHGEDGFEGFRRIQSGDIHERSPDLLYAKNCLLASFEDKRYLDKKDLAVIKNLGLSFRGKDSWPLFRHYEPGFFPWYISEVQAKFLIICLEQIMDTALRFKRSPNLLKPKHPEEIFARVYSKDGLKEGWNDEWIFPEFPRRVVMIKKSIDEEKIRAIAKKAKPTPMTWEADFSLSSATIGGHGERPYFPLLYLVSDHDSFFIFNMRLEQAYDHGAKMDDLILETMDKHGIYPKQIIFRKPEVGGVLKYLTDRLGIVLRQAKNLPAVDDARKGLDEALGKRRGD